MEKAEEQNLFQELGLQVTHGDVEVGKTYMIFGMITEIELAETGFITLTINHNITAKLKAEDDKKIEFLKAKAFESGIFVSKITQLEPSVEANCKTIIFGRPQAKHA